MPTNVLSTPYKLKASSRKALAKFLNGEAGINETAQAMSTTRQRVYTMATAIFRHAASSGKLDIKVILKDY